MFLKSAIRALLLASCVHAAPLLPLRVVESTQMNFGHPLSELTDGDVSPDNGLDMDRAQFQEQVIVFATEKPVSAQVFQVMTWHVSKEKGTYPAQLELAVTSDEKPSWGGNWKPLRPSQVLMDSFPRNPLLARSEGDWIYLAGGLDQAVLTLRAPAALTGVTGFRLRLMPVEASHISGQKVIGRSRNGNCVINEFQVQVDPLRSTNLALGRPVKSSGEVYEGLYPHFLTDGFIATFSHPPDWQPARDFYYEVDLGATRPLDYIVLRGRLDGTAPERLGDYELQVLDDDGTGQPGAVRWRARMRQDGSHVPPGGRDVIQAEDGTGTSFSGRFVRVLNPIDAFCRPQVSEFEVYPKLHPRITGFHADGREIGLKEPPPGTQTLGFTLAAGKDDAAPELLAFRWRQSAVNAPWQECGTGEMATISTDEPGIYPIEFQARHTDGRWSRSIQSHLFSVPRAWWRNPVRVGMIACGSLILAAGAAWWLSVRRLHHKLQLAQAARAIEQDRLRIARDMHDDIGARLTHMALLADRIKRVPGHEPSLLTKLAGEARGTVDALDQIVWAVNPRHDTLGSFSDYLCHHATSYLADAGLSCHFESTSARRDSVLPFAIRHPLLMAAKEALQNVVKHAHASRVSIHVGSTGDAVEIDIRDDGKGLSGTDDPSGDGLSNMRGRLAEIGGTCIIGRSPEGGTRVTLTVPPTAEPCTPAPSASWRTTSPSRRSSKPSLTASPTWKFWRLILPPRKP
ncbi:histidine kinase [Luteolibacter arcticus]|uniref:Histidine kinase n=2 Tax=Luteolibacter arcticus TaxID=1581411 RepID=A0ABT3GP76_9BACT|nr:histidine kinase [Luteolibacter arcticus]